METTRAKIEKAIGTLDFIIEQTTMGYAVVETYSEDEKIDMIMILLGYGSTADQPGWETRDKIRNFIRENEK